MKHKTKKVVYSYWLNGACLYVGSGCLQRPYSNADRCKEILDLWNSIEIKIEAEDISNSTDAVLKEQELIDELKPLYNKNKAAKTIELNYEYLSKYFSYDEESPSGLVWKYHDSPASRIKIGSVAGTLNTKQYWRVGLHRKYYAAHRVVMCLVTQKEVDVHLLVDHKDRNRLNNSFENLRVVTPSENAFNKVRKNNTGERNISENKKCSYYVVTWTGDGDERCSDRFSFALDTTKEDAFNFAIKFRDSLIEEGFITTL